MPRGGCEATSRRFENFRNGRGRPRISRKSAVHINTMATKLPATALWPPTRIMRVIRGLETSTGPLYVTTDTGRAYVKTLGNPEGPDALVSEWIGTRLAQWLGLPTFDIAVVEYPEGLEFKLPKGCMSVISLFALVVQGAPRAASWSCS